MTTLLTLGITGKLDDGHTEDSFDSGHAEDSFDGVFIVFRSFSCCIYKFHRKQVIQQNDQINASL